MSNILESQPLKNWRHIFRFNNFYYVATALLLFGLSFKSPLFLGGFLTFLFFFYRRINLYLLCFLLVIFTLFNFLLKQPSPQTIQGIYQVVDSDEFSYNNRYTIKKGFRKYHFYSHETYQIGDRLYVEGDVTSYDKQRIPYGFYAQEYYVSHHVYGQVKLTKNNLQKGSFHFYQGRELLKKKLLESPSKPFLIAFIFGEPIRDEDSRSSFENFPILFLFTVSGLHLYGFVRLLKKVMFYFNVPPNLQEVVVFICLFWMGYLNRFNYAVLRIILIFILRKLNQRYSLHLNPLDLICLTFLIMLLIHPGYLYHQGFLMTFIIVVGLELFHPFHQRFLGLERQIVISWIVLLLTLPFTKELALLQWLVTPFLLGPVMIGLYSFAMISLWFVRGQWLFNQMMQFVIKLVEKLGTLRISFFLPQASSYLIAFYYVLIIYLFLSQSLKQSLKRLVILILALGCFLCYQQFSTQKQVFFLDVGQGDSSLVLTPDCNFLIDSFNGTHQFLLNLGVRNLDYLFLTHSDLDHILDADKIIRDLKVGEVVISGTDPHYPTYLQKPLALMGEMTLPCGSMDIHLLGPLRSYPLANDNSLVIQTHFYGQTLLFPGDIEVAAEKDLVSHYGSRLKSDLLKVPHHGSKTSSSENFLKKVNPKIAIMSMKQNNRFGFPHDEVLERYQRLGIQIYRTDYQGTIIYDPKKRKDKWQVSLSF